MKFMTKEKFKELCKKYDGICMNIPEETSYWTRNAKHTPKQGTYIQWTTGGMSGGSCWGGNPSPYISGESQPEWDCLNNFLEEVCPDLSFLKYKNLMSKAESYAYTQNEYYGNCTNYAIKCITFDSLYEFFCDKIFKDE
jgi:hypothetical protein